MSHMSWSAAKSFAGSLLPLLLVSSSALPTTNPPASPTVAFVLVFGIPNETVEPLVGLEVKVVDVIDVNIGSGWTQGSIFLESLKGQEVDSGNAYTIRFRAASSNRWTSEGRGDVLTHGGVRFPLMVVETHQDVQLVFGRNGTTFRTIFGLNQYGQYIMSLKYGISAVPRFGYIGQYVLANGSMQPDGQGGWIPFPISQNGKIRIQGQEYDVSLVFVYSFPFD